MITLDENELSTGEEEVSTEENVKGKIDALREAASRGDIPDDLKEFIASLQESQAEDEEEVDDSDESDGEDEISEEEESVEDDDLDEDISDLESDSEDSSSVQDLNDMF